MINNKPILHIVKIPKRSGGYRILVPCPKGYKILLSYNRVKDLLIELYDKYNLTNIGFGFFPDTKKNKSLYLYNALQHSSNRYVLTMDIKDYFNHVNTKMLRYAIRSTTNHLLETYDSSFIENENNEYTKLTSLLSYYEHDIKKYNNYDNVKKEIYNSRYEVNDEKYKYCICYQGLPLSPLLAQFAGIAIDKSIIDKIPYDVTYSRYVDDLTFSTNDKELLNDIPVIVQNVLYEFGLKVSENKTKFTDTQQRRAEVTGLYVQNKGKVYCNRRYRRKVRSALHNLKMIKELYYFLFKNHLDKILIMFYILLYKERLRYIGTINIWKLHHEKSL